MPLLINIRQATMDDHKFISKICKESKYTKDFTNMIFSSQDCYDAGRIRVAEVAGNIVGFTCFRQRKRKPALVLYFIGVTETRRGRGIGRRLMLDLARQSTEAVELNVMKENRAADLYRDMGYIVVGEAYEGKAWTMRSR